MKSQKTMESFIQDSKNPTLHELISQAHYVQRLNTLVTKALSPPLNAHCWVANYREHCLILGTESANWTFYLRFQEQALIKQLRQHPEFAGLNRIECYIKPCDYTPETEPQKIARRLTQDNAQLLTEASVLIKDEQLSKTLARLAAHVTENNK